MSTSFCTCAFTGHRQLSGDFDLCVLERVAEKLVKLGTRRFLFGAAAGFDLISAECILRLKKTYKDITLCACIPFTGQDNYYSCKEKLRYENILKACDEKIVLSDGYYNGCMHMRNRYLVDNSDVLVSYLRQNRGGTYYTVNYARKNNKKIIEI